MSQPEILKLRTKKFSIEMIKLFRELPKTEEARIIGKQVLRSATSIGANYRAVCRARSKAEFIAKIGIVVEEADETVFWLEILIDAKIFMNELCNLLLKEANELLAIMAASQLTAKNNRQ